MMLRYSFALEDEASAVEFAVEKTLKQGYRTKDIQQEGKKLVSTSEMAEQVIRSLS